MRESERIEKGCVTVCHCLVVPCSLCGEYVCFCNYAFVINNVLVVLFRYISRFLSLPFSLRVLCNAFVVKSKWIPFLVRLFIFISFVQTRIEFDFHLFVHRCSVPNVYSFCLRLISLMRPYDNSYTLRVPLSFFRFFIRSLGCVVCCFFFTLTKSGTVTVK